MCALIRRPIIPVTQLRSALLRHPPLEWSKLQISDLFQLIIHFPKFQHIFRRNQPRFQPRSPTTTRSRTTKSTNNSAFRYILFINLKIPNDFLILQNPCRYLKLFYREVYIRTIAKLIYLKSRNLAKNDNCEENPKNKEINFKIDLGKTSKSSMKISIFITRNSF